MRSSKGWIWGIVLLGLLSIDAKVAAADSKTGVIVVDVQGDFTTWKDGSLAVPGSEKAFVQAVERATKALEEESYKIFATQDWHPPDHISFYTNHTDKKPFDVVQIDGRKQILWPPHCVQGTDKARLLVDCRLFQAVVKKGTDPGFDSYSGFKDDGGKKTEMDDVLKMNGIKKLVIYGIATDYCVSWTAQDAVSLGYQVMVVKELCRGVAQDTTAQALKDMRAKGVKILETFDLQEIKEF